MIRKTRIFRNIFHTKNKCDLFFESDFFSQIWTTGEDHSIADVINKEYKTIFSNYDAWYFDCGYAGWVTDGSNWCSPYKGINDCNNIPKNEINFVAKKYNFWLLKKKAV